MATPVVNTSLCSCSFGVAPCPLTVLPAAKVLAANMPMATTADTILMTFGMCQSPANPMVAAATAAALGVLTPMPCTPVPAGIWQPGAPTVLIGGKPALNNSSKLLCAYGGSISVMMSPAVTVAVP